MLIVGNKIYLDKIDREMIDVYCSFHGITFEQFIQDAINNKLGPFMEELEQEAKELEQEATAE